MTALLDRAIDRLSASAWPEVAWQFSRINGDGYPVEFTYSTASSAVRFTAEVAGPEVDERRRFDLALSLLDTPPAAGVESVRAVQARGPLRFGAWVGGGAGRQKVYAECPPGTESDWGIPGARLRMIGLTSGETSSEYYYRRNFLESADAGYLLHRCGLGSRFRDLRDAVERATGRSTEGMLLSTDAGYSVAQIPSGCAMSVFTFARSLWGSDANIRRTLLRLHDMPVYEKASRAVAGREGPETLHGVLAWIVAADRPIEWRISLRPSN